MEIEHFPFGRNHVKVNALFVMFVPGIVIGEAVWWLNWWLS